MVPVAPSWMVWRVLQCTSKRGISSLCCSRSFSACWVGEVSMQYLISMKSISCLFYCMSLNFIARGYGLAAQSLRLTWAILLALLADLV